MAPKECVSGPLKLGVHQNPDDYQVRENSIDSDQIKAAKKAYDDGSGLVQSMDAAATTLSS